MKFNDYQIAQGERSLAKENELINERAARGSAEELRDAYRASLERIKNAAEFLPKAPTLVGLKEFADTIKEIVSAEG